jgi:protein-S-isoprenylcysteine O-methyltransferase Ste14
MSAKTSTRQTGGASPALSLKQVIGYVVFTFVLPLVLFLAAGRLNWWIAWAYVVIYIGMVVTGRVIIFLKNPDLIVERAQLFGGEGVKSWEKFLVPLVALYGPLAVWIVAGLDERFGWSAPFAPWVQVVALVAVALSYLLGNWAMVANRYFSSVVRIQEDRGHTVVTNGPYRFVRHPAYTGNLFGTLAMAIALGSWWALIPAGVDVVGLIVRTALEDRTLRAELPGYADYARQTRSRLFPGIW